MLIHTYDGKKVCVRRWYAYIIQLYVYMPRLDIKKAGNNIDIWYNLCLWCYVENEEGNLILLSLLLLNVAEQGQFVSLSDLIQNGFLVSNGFQCIEHVRIYAVIVTMSDGNFVLKNVSFIHEYAVYGDM